MLWARHVLIEATWGGGPCGALDAVPGLSGYGHVPYSTPSFAEVPASPRSLRGVLEFTIVPTVLPRVLDFIASRPCTLGVSYGVCGFHGSGIGRKRG